MCIDIQSTCVSAYYRYAWWLRKSEEGVRFHETGIIGGCELPYGFLEMKLGLMEEQAIILTSKPFLRFEFFKEILIF